mmetsp:Transcript_25639/g.72587  ORF Transcript_25639/g.72587 Transcript_25639/m.72587 type:complete len:236 (+) Transcript_25639:740-1447(+)
MPFGRRAALVVVERLHVEPAEHVLDAAERAAHKMVVELQRVADFHGDGRDLERHRCAPHRPVRRGVVHDDLRPLEHGHHVRQRVEHVSADIQAVHAPKARGVQIDVVVELLDHFLHHVVRIHLAAVAILLAGKQAVQVLAVVETALAALVPGRVEHRNSDQGAAHRVHVDLAKETEDERNAVQLIAVERAREPQHGSLELPLGDQHRHCDPLAHLVHLDTEFELRHLAWRQALQD